MTIMSSGLLRVAAATDGGASSTRTDSACLPLRPSATPNSTLAPGFTVGALRQRRRVQEHLLAVVGREEAETPLGVEPLDLASGHVGNLLVGDVGRAVAPASSG